MPAPRWLHALGSRSPVEPVLAVPPERLGVGPRRGPPGRSQLGARESPQRGQVIAAGLDGRAHEHAEAIVCRPESELERPVVGLAQRDGVPRVVHPLQAPRLDVGGLGLEAVVPDDPRRAESARVGGKHRSTGRAVTDHLVPQRPNPPGGGVIEAEVGCLQAYQRLDALLDERLVLVMAAQQVPALNRPEGVGPERPLSRPQ